MADARGFFPLTTTSPTAPAGELVPLRRVVGDAVVVGLARGAHGTNELTRLSHRLVVHLIVELGFRALAIEASPTVTTVVDDWLCHGRGDLTPLLRDAHPWWRSAQFGDLLRWVSRFNQSHVEDPVTLIGVESSQPSRDALERAMADTIVDAQAQSGRRIVYWSGSHSAVGHRRAVRWRSEDPVGVGSRNAGSYLREHLGEGYRSLGLSFHHGAVRLGDAVVTVPPAPSDFLGTSLDHDGLALHVLCAEHEVADRPLRFRLIGPFFDPDRPAEMSGGPVSEFFDAVLHVERVLPDRPDQA